MTTSGTKENTYMKSVTLHFLTGDKYDRVDEYYECVAGATYAKYDSSKKHILLLAILRKQHIFN